MFYIIHALIGCIIGGCFNSWAIIAILAVASHFFIDMIPHWDGPYNRLHFEKTGKLKMSKIMPFIEVFDFIISILLAIYLSHRAIVIPGKLMAIGVIASVAPDVIKLGYFTPLKKKRHFMGYLKFHSRLQNEVGWKKGLFVQMLVFVILLIIFKWV